MADIYDEDALLDALAVVVKKANGYNDNNVAVGNHRILDGGVNKAVVFEAGPILSAEDEETRYFGGVVSIYEFVAYIYRRFTYDAETREKLRDDTKNVRTIIDKYHRLNGNAESCKLTTVSDPVYVTEQQGTPPYFMARRATVRVRKLENLETAE